MNGIDESISLHLKEDALRAKMFECLAHLRSALGGPHYSSRIKTIIEASITPWGTKQGFDIHLRALPGTYDELKDVIAAELQVDFIKMDCDNVRFENWRPDAKIYLHRH